MARKEANDTVLNEMNDNPSEPKMEVATPSTMELGQVEGEVNAGDIRLPRLQIAYGVGGLSETFNPGDLVLNAEELLVHKGEELRFIVVTARKYWKERLDQAAFAAGITPSTYTTEAEVIAAGGTTRWKDGVGPNYSPALNLRMLIEKPNNIVSGLFGIKVGDTEHAPAEWDIDKSAYKKAAPVILSASQFSLRKRGLLSGKFAVVTRSEKTRSGNMVVVPVVKLAAHNTDAEIADIKRAFGQEEG